ADAGDGDRRRSRHLSGSRGSQKSRPDLRALVGSLEIAAAEPVTDRAAARLRRPRHDFCSDPQRSPRAFARDHGFAPQPPDILEYAITKLALRERDDSQEY